MRYLTPVLRVALTAGLAASALVACTDTPERTTAPLPGGPSFASGSNAGANLDQWANGKTPPTGESWQNGNLNGNNSAYAEGRAVPFRLAIEGLTIGTHFITIQYDFTAGGHKAYDFLAVMEATEPNALAKICATGGGGRSTLCGSSTAAMPGSVDSSSFAFTPDGQTVDGLTVDAAMSNDGAPRSLRIYGGTITSISTVTHKPNNDFTGNSTGEMLVEFTAAGPAVLFAWSGHLARSSFWNGTNDPDGAGEVSGSPWHMRTLNLDGGGAANQDRSIQPSAIVENPVLVVAKTANPAGPVSAGTNIGFDITVTNSGPGTATAVTLIDTLPNGFTWTESPDKTQCSIGAGALGETILTCGTIGDLANGASFSVHITSPTDAADCKTHTNKAWADASNDDPVNASASVTVLCGSLAVTKTANPVGPVSAGTNIGFDITVTNNGPGVATAVTLTDTLPNGFSWAESPDESPCSIGTGALGEKILTCNTIGDLANGASFSVHLTSPTDAADCRAVNNVAWADAGNTDPVSDDATVTVQCPNIAVTKTANPVGPVSAGTNIGFDIVVTNSGPGTATGVTVTDTLPAGFSWTENSNSCQIDTGALGEKILHCSGVTLTYPSGNTFSVTVTTPTAAANCAVVHNRTWADASNDDPVNDDASVTVQCPNIAITKTANPVGPVLVGNNIGFDIVVSNSGPGTATGVTVTDTLPAGFSWTDNSSSCTVDTGALGEKILHCTGITLTYPSGNTFSVTVTTPTVAANCALISNKAWADATNDDPVNDDASVTVVCPPNLQITKTPEATSVTAGGTAKYTITVTNTGPGAATNVVIKDTLQNSGLNWSEDVDKSECSIVLDNTIPLPLGPHQVLTCSGGALTTLAAGASYSVTVKTIVPLSYVQIPPSGSNADPIQIDGNLIDDGAGVDWNNAGLVCATKTGCDLDKPTGTGDDSFGQGTKEDTPVPTVVSGSIPNNKSDLLRFYVATRRQAVNGANHDILYLAWERVQAPNGTTNMDFELNKLAPVSPAVSSVRSAGDVLIKYDLSKGGGTLALGYHKWVTAASAGGQTPAQACEAANTFPCWGKVHALAAPVGVGASNVTQKVDDANAPDATRSLDLLTFGEAGIDLQAAEIFGEGVCTAFGAAYLKSRSSDSFTSEIKDFIAPLPVNITNCQSVTIHNTAWASASNFTPPGAGKNPGDGISASADITVTAPTASLFTAPAGRELAHANVGLTLTSNAVVVDTDVEASGLRARSVTGRERAENPWPAHAISAARTASGRGAVGESPWRQRIV
jgi:uncharacterized repeat protein (TIGR01451 family)